MSKVVGYCPDINGCSYCKNFYEHGYEKGKKDAVVHGRWIEKIETSRTFEEVDVQTSIECSVCGRRYWDTPGYDIDNGEYPPSCLCGARMDAPEGAEDG